MIKKFAEIEINKENIDLIIKSMDSNANHSKKLNSPKYLIIDWSDVKADQIDFSKFGDVDDIRDFFIHQYEWINNRELLLHIFKNYQYKNEDFLWNMLVDDHIISDKLYQLNSYEENFAILMKITKFKI
jgi:hypothetical protein